MKMIIANFKSNKTIVEIEHWIEQFSTGNTQRAVQVVLCPAMPHLYAFQQLKDDNISLGVQDISPYPAGAYTGAVGTLNLVGLDVKYAVVGHSERRKYFHETQTDVANKVRECLTAGITPIVCVTKTEIHTQANLLDALERAACIVAFEPVDHIGTGESDSLEDILETKSLVQTAFGNVPYIYGGSVNPSTSPAILQSTEINGFLVGNASLDARAFQDLLLQFDI